MSKYEKLMLVQAETHATKAQQNNYYKYRNVEQIMAAVKPVLKKNKATIFVSDELVMVGERYYIKATATFVDMEDGGKVETTAYAREPLNSRTMGESQVTGSTSSYARKYALCGLLLLDDNKVEEKIIDPDCQEYLENEGINPNADKTEGLEKSAKSKTEYVKFENGIWYLLNDQGIYTPLSEISTENLSAVIKMRIFKDAWKAIGAELDNRALRGELA